MPTSESWKPWIVVSEQDNCHSGAPRLSFPCPPANRGQTTRQKAGIFKEASLFVFAESLAMDSLDGGRR